MSIEALLYQYNPWWESDFSLEGVIERKALLDQLYPLLDTPEVIVLTGLRRVGKTVSMKCLINHLINRKKVSPKYCLYVSMDDYQLRNTTLLELVECYRQIQRVKTSESIYLFLDEITYLQDFQVQLKNLYDKGIKCVVSASSSSVLKDESAHLTGRNRIIEVDPLNFDEFLSFKGYSTKKSEPALKESYFLEYMTYGGMPEYVLRGDREYMITLIDDIIMKDIVAYHGIRQPDTIRSFFILLMERAGKQISINKVANILDISPDTAKRYLNMFEQAYLVHTIPRHGKTNEKLLSARKVYATDLGMRNVTVGFRDKGAIFENIVFMYFKKHRPEYVLVDAHEIDFLIKQILVEVKYQREIEGKQKVVFEAFSSDDKFVIKNINDLEHLAKLFKK